MRLCLQLNKDEWTVQTLSDNYFSQDNLPASLPAVMA